MNVNISDVARVVEAVKKHRLRKICKTVKQVVKRSGGWNKAFPDSQKCSPASKFDLTSKTGEWCTEELRMLSGDVNLLRHHLGIPREFRTPNRDSASGVDALCMLLYRLSWPRKFFHLRLTFGCSAHRVSRIANSLAVYLYNRFSKKLDSLDRVRLNDDYLISMARAQFRKNGILEHIIGFIDATVRPCCRSVTPPSQCFPHPLTP